MAARPARTPPGIGDDKMRARMIGSEPAVRANTDSRRRS